MTSTLSTKTGQSQEETFDVTAYCFMPDHIHVLAAGTSEESDLRRYVSRWKQVTGYQYKGMTGGRLWQPPYWGSGLWTREQLIEEILNTS